MTCFSIELLTLSPTYTSTKKTSHPHQRTWPPIAPLSHQKNMAINTTIMSSSATSRRPRMGVIMQRSNYPGYERTPIGYTGYTGYASSLPITSNSESRTVYTVTCPYCTSCLSERAMRANLLPSPTFELMLSASQITPIVQPSSPPRSSISCECLVRDMGCGTCGNVVGYHVETVCTWCSRAGHNGHRYVFLPKSVFACESKNALWARRRPDTPWKYVERDTSDRPGR